MAEDRKGECGCSSEDKLQYGAPRPIYRAHCRRSTESRWTKCDARFLDPFLRRRSTAIGGIDQQIVSADPRRMKRALVISSPRRVSPGSRLVVKGSVRCEQVGYLEESETGFNLGCPKVAKNSFSHHIPRTSSLQTSVSRPNTATRRIESSLSCLRRALCQIRPEA